MKKKEQWLLSAVFAVLFIVLNGYQFNNGDQEEHLPYVYKLLNPDLYASDYLVPRQVEQFTVRFFYAHFLAFFMQWIPPWPLVFVFHVICLTITGYAVTGLAALKSERALAPPLAVILLLVVNQVTIGGNGLLDVQLTCSTFALALGALAVLRYEVNSSPWWAVFCGLSVLFQPLIGLHLFILLFLSRLWKTGLRNRAGLMYSGLLFMLFSAPMLVPLFLQLSKGGIGGSDELYHQVLFQFRNAHHYLPDCFPWSDYLKTALWWGGILVSTALLKRRGEADTVVPVMVITATGCIIYFVLFRGLELSAVGLSQWFKATIWTGFFGVPVVAAFVSNLFRGDVRIRSRHYFIFGGCLTLLLFAIFFSGMLPAEKWKNRYKFSFYSDSDLGRIHHWIRENTPENAVVLPCPDDDSFLCEAGRSIPVGYKAIIHDRTFMLEWYEKMQRVYGAGVLSGECKQEVLKRAMYFYSAVSDSQIKASSRIDYRLVRADMLSRQDDWQVKLVHREGDYLLLRFEP